MQFHDSAVLELKIKCAGLVRNPVKFGFQNEMGMTECVPHSDEQLRCQTVLQRDHSVLCENLFEVYQEYI